MAKRLCPLFLTVLVSLTLLAASAYLLGTNDELMLRLMRHCAPPEATALPEQEYPAVVAMITDYLAGKTDVFQHRFTVEGMEYLAFNQKEQQHMADVQNLFILAQTVLLVSLAVAGLMLAFLVLPDLLWETGLLNAMVFAVTGLPPQEMGRSLRNGLLAVLGAVGVVAVLAAIDFNALFILFHKIAFTNDLWLLDPRTDLLIRLMPTDFFVAYAALIGAAWTGAMGLVVLITHLLAKERNDK